MKKWGIVKKVFFSKFVTYRLLKKKGRFDEVIDKMGPFHQQSTSKVYTRRTNDEAFCLAFLFFMYYLGILIS